MATPTTATATHSHHDAVDVPRGVLLAVAAMLAFVLVAAGLSRWLADGASPSQPTAAVVAEQWLRFEDRPDGGITVRQATSGLALREVPPGGDPFLRGALRALVRERRSQGLGAEAPFRLQARADGRLTLLDTGTGRRLDIESFGPAQAAVFARLLAPPPVR